VWDEFGRTNSGDETGGAVQRFGFDISGSKPDIIPATNGAFVYYDDYLALHRRLATPPTEPAPQAEPAAPQERTLLQQYDLDQSPDYRKGYQDGRLKGFEVGLRHATEQAQAGIPATPVLNATREPAAVGELPPLEIDYDALIAAAFKLHRYAQGTRGCVAFKHGAEWMRDYARAALASAPHARKPLSAEQIADIWAECSTDNDDGVNVENLARAVERAHGIG
jgi:hypothetical protein